LRRLSDRFLGARESSREMIAEEAEAEVEEDEVEEVQGSKDAGEANVDTKLYDR
jgi:hypothetical protein